MDDILRAAVAASTENPGHLHTLVSCCGHLGLAEEAANSIATRNRLGPPLRLGALRQRMAGSAHDGVFIEGLAKAGVPA
jgi:adenylate cyclase